MHNCPECGSENLDMMDQDIDSASGYIILYFNCEDCGCQFSVDYDLLNPVIAITENGNTLD